VGVLTERSPSAACPHRASCGAEPDERQTTRTCFQQRKHVTACMCVGGSMPPALTRVRSPRHSGGGLGTHHEGTKTRRFTRLTVAIGRRRTLRHTAQHSRGGSPSDQPCAGNPHARFRGGGAGYSSCLPPTYYRSFVRHALVIFPRGDTSKAVGVSHWQWATISGQTAMSFLVCSCIGRL